MERATSPANIFRRFRLNVWTTEGDSPFMPEEGWECFKPHLSEKISCHLTRHYIGVDLGVKKDAAAIIVLHREKNGLVVDRIQRWKGSKQHDVPLMEVERFLAECLQNYSNVTLVCDPWQAMGLIQKFKALGIEVIEFFYTAQNLVKLSKNLFYLFKNMNLYIPKHDTLETELGGLQIVQKSYGWRIDHEADNSSDICMSLGMAAVIAMEQGIQEEDLNSTLEGLYYEERTSIFKIGEKRKFADININIGSQNVPAEEIPKIQNSSTKRLF